MTKHFKTRSLAASSRALPDFTKVAAGALIAGLLCAIPSPVQAFGFGSFPTLLRPKAEASVNQSKTMTVQTMPILEASMSPNPAKGGGDILIVDDQAVIADEGPAGTMADISKPKNTQISIYVVKEGDTLSGIAELFNVSANTIKWANDISAKGTIRVGQTLTILPVTGIKHTVKKGDTLASLAKQYHGDADEIANYNSIESLVVGKEILIPNGEIAAAPVVKKSAGVGAAVSGGSSSYAGYFLRPISGGTRTQGVHGYNGVDLAAPQGTPIYASATGDVIVAKEGGWNGGYGSYVVITHDNGTQTLYAHQSRIGVAAGQRVSQGEVIGYVGATGKVSGPTGSHVHFEIRGGPRNPF